MITQVICRNTIIIFLIKPGDLTGVTTRETDNSFLHKQITINDDCILIKYTCLFIYVSIINQYILQFFYLQQKISCGFGYRTVPERL